MCAAASCRFAGRSGGAARRRGAGKRSYLRGPVAWRGSGGGAASGWAAAGAVTCGREGGEGPWMEKWAGKLPVSNQKINCLIHQ